MCRISVEWVQLPEAIEGCAPAWVLTAVTLLLVSAPVPRVWPDRPAMCWPRSRPPRATSATTVKVSGSLGDNPNTPATPLTGSAPAPPLVLSLHRSESVSCHRRPPGTRCRTAMHPAPCESRFPAPDAAPCRRARCRSPWRPTAAPAPAKAAISSPYTTADVSRELHCGSLSGCGDPIIKAWSRSRELRRRSCERANAFCASSAWPSFRYAKYN